MATKTDLENIPESIEDTRKKEEAMLESAVNDCIMGSRKHFTVTNKIGIGTPYEREVTLNMRWPDLDDQAEIASRAASFHFAPLASLSTQDQNLAQARAAIEVLAVGPFPDWLPPQTEPANVNGRMQFRPDTGKVKSIAAPLAVYYKYVEVFNRFQRLVV